LQLFATFSSELQECFRILEIIVILAIDRLRLRSDDFARTNGWARPEC
jgi:hypothetical protein